MNVRQLELIRVAILMILRKNGKVYGTALYWHEFLKIPGVVS